MDGRPTRRQFLQGGSVAGLALVGGCASLPWQVAPPAAKVHRIASLSGGPPNPG
jgi:hypothetical protein